MKTILLIQGRETREFAKGNYNTGLMEVAQNTLKDHFELLFTDVERPYDVAQEIVKYKQADAVIYQYPVYWFMMPSILKKYIDDVWQYGEFFAGSDGKYGTGGLMQSRKFMLSTTWNAPAHAFNDTEQIFEGGSADDAQAPMRRAHFFCDFQELEHFGCHDIIANPSFEEDAKRYEAHLRKIFL